MLTAKIKFTDLAIGQKFATDRAPGIFKKELGAWAWRDRTAEREPLWISIHNEDVTIFVGVAPAPAEEVRHA